MSSETSPALRPSSHGLTLYGASAAAIFFASSSAPTPVYHLYQESFHLSHLQLTIIFAAYAVSLLVALLTVGSLSDYIGRKPMIFLGLVMNALAMLVFIRAGSAAELITARVIQGFASGAAVTTLGAAILDYDKQRGPVINSITGFVGLTAGSLVSGALVAFAPAPTMLVYAILLALSAALLVLLWRLPETAAGKAGAWASLVPHVSVPPQARKTLAKITPVNIAGWGLGGFYFSLMPSLVREATGVTSPFLGGIVVATLTLTATFVVLILRNRPGTQILTIGTISLILGVSVTLLGVYLHTAIILMLGAVVTGVGFGACYSGAMRTVIPLAAPNERAGLLATFFVQSYLAFSLPAILVGMAAPVLGLSVSAYIYGGGVIVLAVISLIATRSSAETLSQA